MQKIKEKLVCTNTLDLKIIKQTKKKNSTNTIIRLSLFYIFFNFSPNSSLFQTKFINNIINTFISVYSNRSSAVKLIYYY